MGNKNQLFLYVFYTWVVISDSINGLESKSLNKYRKIDLNTNIESQCICLERSHNQHTMPDLLDPRKEGLERLLIFLYKDSTGKIQLYIPGQEKQATIPDLHIEDTDLSVVVTSEVTIESLFYHNDRVLTINPFKDPNERPVNKPNLENDGIIHDTEISNTPTELFEEAPPSWPEFDSEYFSTPEQFNAELQPKENIPHPQINKLTPSTEPHEDSYIVSENTENSTTFFNYNPLNDAKESYIPIQAYGRPYVKTNNKNKFVLPVPVYNANANILPVNYGPYYSPNYGYIPKPTFNPLPKDENQFSTFVSEPESPKVNDYEVAPQETPLYRPDLIITSPRPTDDNEESISNYQPVNYGPYYSPNYGLKPKPTFKPHPKDENQFSTFVSEPDLPKVNDYEVAPQETPLYHPDLTPPRPTEDNEESISNYQPEPMIPGKTNDDSSIDYLSEAITPYSSDNLHDAIAHDQGPIVISSPTEEISQISNEKDPSSINSNPIISDLTFNQWFATQLKNMESKTSFTTIDINTLEILIKKSLMEHGLYVSSKGKLIDSNGRLLNMSNLHIRPLLIGEIVEYDKLLAKHTNYELPRDLPYLESLLITLLYPPKIIGIIPMGKFYLPTSIGQVGVSPHSNLHSVTTNSKEQEPFAESIKYILPKPQTIQISHTIHRKSKLNQTRPQRIKDDKFINAYSDHSSQDISEIQNRKYEKVLALQRESTNINQSESESTDSESVDFSATDENNSQSDLADDTNTPQITYPFTDPLEISTDQSNVSGEEKDSGVLDNNEIMPINLPLKENEIQEKEEQNISSIILPTQNKKNKKVKKQKGKTIIQFSNIKNFKEVMLKLMKLFKMQKLLPPKKEVDEDLVPFDPEFRIIGGAAATGSGSPISSRGRSGLIF